MSMDKQELIYAIKAWLQMFGDRDNETFNYELPKWTLSLQYDYDMNGYRVEPYNWCRSSFKHAHYNSLEDRTELELIEILDELKSIKANY